ncbi:MAG TPA: universal stress protein [Mycobacteriales bacterium]|nr:universal stress protein [Mycobacteriales bacterium]
MTGTSNRPYIVVGVDGSDASKDALRWAARQAQLTGAELRAIAAWELVPTYPYPVVIDADLRDRTSETLATAVDDAFGADPPARLVAEVHRGHPASVLVEASRGAEMLVVGASGHGTFTDMLLGSVSQHCAHHATCPLVIVRQHKPAG